MASISIDREVQRRRPGAVPLSDDCTRFTVWAPRPETIQLHLFHPENRLIPLHAGQNGMYSVDVPGVSKGARYFYAINGVDRPDPASRYQPEGVHGPSEVVDVEPAPPNSWHGLPLSDYVIYELHVGTFTPEGTLDAAILELKRLRDLEITAVELMPVVEFPGSRNWGYDGVYPYAVHHAYGGPAALRRLANACHEQDMALVLDVVYNHLGPEGNYLGEYGPYFTSQYRTPWGDALNFDDAGSDQVRRYFIENALYWADCGVDALRLDAVHSIYDRTAHPFLRQLAEAVHDYGGLLGRSLHLIAESDLNDPRLIAPAERNGFGLDAQWSDDFHHCLHTLLTGERHSFYQDFGELRQMAETFRYGWLYSGQYSPFRGRRHGNSPAAVRSDQLVVYSQNHDHIGNRARGERLITIAGYEAAKLAADAVLLSPFIPMIFMGEEYGETAPFLYFVSHSDQQLTKAVSEGRRKEFPQLLDSADFPEPNDERTFLSSKLNRSLIGSERHAAMQRFYADLLRLRHSHPALRNPSKSGMSVLAGPRTILLCRSSEEHQALILLYFDGERHSVQVHLPRGRWTKVLDSCDTSEVPFEIEAAGEALALSLSPCQAVVFSS